MSANNGLLFKSVVLVVCVATLIGLYLVVWPRVTTLYAQLSTHTTTGTPLQPTTLATPGPATPRQSELSVAEQGRVALYWLLGGGSLFVVALFLVTGHRGIKRGRKTHGSAHLATWSELRAFRPTFVERLQKRREPRLIIGRRGWHLVSLSQRQQEQNVLLTAPVGSGKSSGIIIPNILRERGTRSLFIPDVKGELLKLTGGAVARFHKVWVFAPMRPEQSQGYNPLAFVHKIEDAQDLAHCWVMNTGTSNDTFWSNTAKKLITAAILHLRTAEPAAPFSRLATLLVHTPLEQLREILTKSPAPLCAQEATPFFEYLDQNERMAGSIMADMGTRFQLLLSDEIRQVTSSNDLDFRMMAEQPTALYLSIPRRGAERCQPLLACFTMQMFNVWEQRAEEEHNGRLPVGMMCYMDEFANLGYIPRFDSYISTARASGVAMLLAVQSLSQIDNRYGKALRNIILSNTVTHLLLPGAGQEETEYYSARIGNATIRTQGYSDNGHGAGNRSEGESARRLLTADELRTLKQGTILMLPGAHPPIVPKALPYYKNRRLSRLAFLPFTVTIAATHGDESIEIQKANDHHTHDQGDAPVIEPDLLKEDEDHFRRLAAGEEEYEPI